MWPNPQIKSYNKVINAAVDITFWGKLTTNLWVAAVRKKVLICDRNKGYNTNRSSLPKMFYENGSLRNFPEFTGKHLWPETQVFLCEFREIS